MGRSCTVQALWPLIALVAASASVAQGATRTEPRSVTWYADNPQARARVQLACLDDPGRLGRTPDCINAHQASVAVALREARARTGEMNPERPAFWSSSPEARRSKLLMCRRNPQLLHCDAAKRSLQLEAGLIRM
jgi:hypothetical protein